MMKYSAGIRKISARSANHQRSGSAKGQAAVEVLIYLGFFMLVFVSLTVLFLMQVNQDVVRRQYHLSQSAAEQVAQDVELAMLAGPGFNATFEIPTHIAGQEYELYFNDAGFMYINLTNTNPAASPVMFYFPLSTRRFLLGCNGALTPDICPDNYELHYKDFDGRDRTSWHVGTRDGTLRIEHMVDESGLTILRVS